jgi:hypothetical protein
MRSLKFEPRVKLLTEQQIREMSGPTEAEVDFRRRLNRGPLFRSRTTRGSVSPKQDEFIRQEKQPATSIRGGPEWVDYSRGRGKGESAFEPAPKRLTTASRGNLLTPVSRPASRTISVAGTAIASTHRRETR